MKLASRPSDTCRPLRAANLNLHLMPLPSTPVPKFRNSLWAILPVGIAMRSSPYKLPRPSISHSTNRPSPLLSFPYPNQRPRAPAFHRRIPISCRLAPIQRWRHQWLIQPRSVALIPSRAVPPRYHLLLSLTSRRPLLSRNPVSRVPRPPPSFANRMFHTLLQLRKWNRATSPRSPLSRTPLPSQPLQRLNRASGVRLQPRNLGNHVSRKRLRLQSLNLANSP